MNHWMCDDKSPVLPLRDLRPMCVGRPPEPKGDHSLVSQKGSNYFLRIDPNTKFSGIWEKNRSPNPDLLIKKKRTFQLVNLAIQADVTRLGWMK